MSARAFISAIGFRDRWEDLDAEVEDAGSEAALFNLEKVLDRGVGETNWSVPLWARPGDVIFFYCTANWPMRLKRLDQSIDVEIAPRGPRDLARARKLLARAWELSRSYAGSVVSVGIVAGDPEYSPPPSDGGAFRDAHAADIESIAHGTKVPSSVLRELRIRIRRAATTTPLHGRAARALLNHMFAGAPPKPFSGIEFWTEACLRKYADDWRRLVASDDFRPRNEEEVRALFVDPLVDLLAGANGKVWRECRTIVKTRSAGIADYIVELGSDKHLVVEAKLRATNLERAMDQTRRYLAARRATPQVGEAQGQSIRVFPIPQALLIDSDGVYLTSAETPASPAAPTPTWGRTWFATVQPKAIRGEMLSVLEGSA